ncbi:MULTISPECIES: B12-binding domain-containing radical SAM protein [Ferrimicrobium]|uniref:B12-binding domain-containing radical SAM protein n=1 Tax=Ferrimicrobium TaxID=121038 RepID=UPI0023F0F55D|nr:MULTISPECIES: radical SAM protein [Ferrimicrobium]
MLLGHDPLRPLDAILVNAPLKDYGVWPRHNDYTLPVLGMAYIATYCAQVGFNVAVLDAEAAGLGIAKVAEIVNREQPRWVGLNLLAPTYRLSRAILQAIDHNIQVMLGGHHAKAMPIDILNDPLIPRVDALVIGEAETRVAALLDRKDRRKELPGVMWVDRLLHAPVRGGRADSPSTLLAPDINTMPFVDRSYLAQDPFLDHHGILEANMVGSRGCPYNCSFCGAAASSNPDVEIRTRLPGNLVAEMRLLADSLGVEAFRFVDDLFLASPPFIRACMAEFIRQGVGEWSHWDATGRINVLSRVSDELLDVMREAGCREVALGVESGSSRLLSYMQKKITPEMTEAAVRRLTERGISVKGYFILGYPTETVDELKATLNHIDRLWEIADSNSGSFRASVFEFRPYPGTLEWDRLTKDGKYSPSELLEYEHVDLTASGATEAMRQRDEFNFSVNIQFGEAPISSVRKALARVTALQHERGI